MDWSGSIVEKTLENREVGTALRVSFGVSRPDGIFGKDNMIVFGEAHLRRILRGYAAYYNAARTHRSLNKDAPFHRAIQRLGAIASQPVLGGPHHQYCRI